MGLRNIVVKNEYRSPQDNIVKDFYIPLLNHAVLYERAVGYFSSSILASIAEGVLAVKFNNGKIRIVASPNLNEDDIEAIRIGYDKRNQILKNVLFQNLEEPKNIFEKDNLNLLVNLIEKNYLDIKIAVTDKKGRVGMYHEKLGIISDNQGNSVVFSGSMNETDNAVFHNYETIDVFCSWKPNDTDRVNEKRNAFQRIWENKEEDLIVFDFPELPEELIKKYKTHNIADYQWQEEIQRIKAASDNTPPEINKPTFPKHLELRDYQLRAISEWEKNDYRGIFDMATGTGKTITGLSAVLELLKTLDNKLAVIVVAPYQHLVEQWVEDIIDFNIKPIIGYSASSQKNWLSLLDNAIRDQKLQVANKEFFCFICTNATFSTEKVQSLLSKIKGAKLLVVDEAHNFGAESLSKLLINKYTYRLALSATLERHNDIEGTKRLYDFFGDKCIEYTLERAIEEEKLTKYKYYPILTKLSDLELDVYSQLSYEISKCVIIDKSGKVKLTEKGKMLALKRARVVAGAINKLVKLEEYITQYKNDRHILVYCGATNILPENQDYSEINKDDIRQIDAVTELLGNKLGMNIAQFTSRENIQKREILKHEFATAETLQALVAIKCLDEGVNIPKIKIAFILASTTNPKEYIQRRGRVLRLAEGKDFAEIYDFITLPRDLDEVHFLTEEQRKRELTLVKNEISRAEEFARLAMNMGQAEKIINEVKEAYSINEHLFDYEEDYLNG